MRKLTTKEIVLLIALVFIVSAALYYNYFFKPYQLKIFELEANINTNTQRHMTLQNEQQSIIRDTEKLQNELAGVDAEFQSIPVGIDEPYMLVFIEDALSGTAKDSSISFSTETSVNEYFQTSQVRLAFSTTYPELKIILDSFYNAPFINRVVMLNTTYEDEADILGPQLAQEPAEGEAPADTPEPDYLYVEMTLDCFTIPGAVENKAYDFMTGPFGNSNPYQAPDAGIPQQ